MKKRFFLLATAFVFLVGAPYVQAKSPENPSLDILNHHDQEKIHGRSIRLVLKVTPSPDRHRPVHLHVYVNGRMAAMITINSPQKVVTLHHLQKGKNVISFVQANPMTHREMVQINMKNEEMGGMNSEMNPTKKKENEPMKANASCISITVASL